MSKAAPRLKLRVMPVFVQDALSDLWMSQLSTLAYGAYWKLAFTDWLEDGLPNDERLLRRISGLHGNSWRAVWYALSPKWELQSDGKLRNSRVKTIRNRSENKVNSARNAANVRHHGHADAMQQGTGNREQDHCTSYNGSLVAAPPQREMDFEKGALPTESGDVGAKEAIWEVFDYWRTLYPEHARAQLQGRRPALIKTAIANRRKATGCSRRDAVEQVKAALNASLRDSWCSGVNKEGTTITELSALLSTEVLERLCREASGQEPRQAAIRRPPAAPEPESLPDPDIVGRSRA